MITIKKKTGAASLGGGPAGTEAQHHPMVARIRELLDYDPETGIFTWKVSRGRMKAGSQAGSPNQDGTIQIRIDSRLYTTKQLARAYASGKWDKSDWYDRKLNQQFKGKVQKLRPAQV